MLAVFVYSTLIGLAALAWAAMRGFLSDLFFAPADVRTAWRLMCLPVGAALAAATLSTSYGLYQSVPVLRWSWWSALAAPALRHNLPDADSVSLLAVAAGIAVLPALPTIAQFAEVVFRSGTAIGTQNPGAENLTRAMACGAAHAAAGVPLAVCVAAVVPALALTAIYRSVYTTRTAQARALYKPAFSRRRPQPRAPLALAAEEAARTAVNTTAAVNATYMACAIITACALVCADAIA